MMARYKKQKFHFYKNSAGKIIRSKDYDYWQIYLDGLPINNAYYTTVSKVFNKRSPKLNNYFHKLCSILVDDWGDRTLTEGKIDIKWYLVLNFPLEFPFMIANYDNKPDKLTSSADWSNTEMSSVCEKLILVSPAEWNIRLLTPEEWKENEK